MIALRAAACLFAVLLGSACVGTETGNPSGRHVSVALVLKSSDPRQVQVGDSDGDDVLNVHSAWLAADYLELLACADHDQAELGPAAWDLMLPEARRLYTVIPSFCGVHLETRLADRTLGVVPPELVGASLWVTATRPDGTPVEVRSTAPLSFVSSGLPLTTARLVLSFDVATWFSGFDVDDLVPGDDGVVRLSATSNAPLLLSVEQMAADGATLREQRSDDDVLGD